MSDPTPSPAASTDTSAPCGSSPASCGSTPTACGGGACGGTDAELSGKGVDGPGQAGDASCCGGEADAATSLSQARRVVVVTGLIGLTLSLAGLILGGWVGFILVAAVSVGIGSALARAWPRLSTNDRWIRVAVLTLLLALALVRALPR